MSDQGQILSLEENKMDKKRQISNDDEEDNVSGHAKRRKTCETKDDHENPISTDVTIKRQNVQPEISRSTSATETRSAEDDNVCGQLKEDQYDKGLDTRQHGLVSEENDNIFKMGFYEPCSISYSTQQETKQHSFQGKISREKKQDKVQREITTEQIQDQVEDEVIDEENQDKVEMEITREEGQDKFVEEISSIERQYKVLGDINCVETQDKVVDETINRKTQAIFNGKKQDKVVKETTSEENHDEVVGKITSEETQDKVEDEINSEETQHKVEESITSEETQGNVKGEMTSEETQDKVEEDLTNKLKQDKVNCEKTGERKSDEVICEIVDNRNDTISTLPSNELSAAAESTSELQEDKTTDITESQSHSAEIAQREPEKKPDYPYRYLYRLLRSDEKPCTSGIRAKAPWASVSIENHVRRGSHGNSSKYISTSANIEGARRLRGICRKTINPEIAKIDCEGLTDVEYIDLTKNEIRGKYLSSQKANNHAIRFDEVLVIGFIPASHCSIV